MDPPRMGGANLTSRFALEMVALGALGVAAWDLTDGPARVVCVAAAPLVAATAWGVFNVPGDPSRSGRAPVPVPGWVRLVVELTILGLGALSLGVVWRAEAAVAFGVLVLAHYAASWARLQWILES